MSFCVRTADILLPKKNVDYAKFAVVACDQFTSEREYWDNLKSTIADSVSALNLILPEAFLKEDNTAEIERINSFMRQYLNTGVFEEYKNCFIYTERETPYSKPRHGIVASIDLEHYSFSEPSPLIRASEGTVLSRIPARVKIRRNAPLELPHIMLLADDREGEVIEPLESEKHKMECVYDFELNAGGGHIRGYLVKDTEKLINKFATLLDPSRLKQKYGGEEKLLFAVGDGNHSLAAAKTIWDSVKTTLSEKEREQHPLRFALVEIVNIHDEGIEFHPIHRVFFVEDKESFISGLRKECAGFTEDTGCIIYNGKREKLCLPENAAEAVRLVQSYADGYTKEHGGSTDYIHGEASVESICQRENAIGVLLPSLRKEDFFEYIVNKGSLPRKTFSMGEACEKRYYIEARKLI